MRENYDLNQKINSIKNALIESGLYAPSLFAETGTSSTVAPGSSKLESILASAQSVHTELRKIAGLMQENVIAEMLELERHVREPQQFEAPCKLLERIVTASDGFRKEVELVSVYGTCFHFIFFSCSAAVPPVGRALSSA